MENPKDPGALTKIIEKIQLLADSAGRPGSMTSLERDLLLQYLRDAYELVVGAAPEKTSAEPVEREVPAAVHQDENMEEGTVLNAEEAIIAETRVENEHGRSAAGLPRGVSVLERFLQEEATDTKGEELMRTSSRNKPLRELITLNDKFMFIRDFFGNSISTYESAIEEIEQLPNKHAVLDYMQEKCWTDAMMEQDRELIDRFISLADAKFSEK